MLFSKVNGFKSQLKFWILLPCKMWFGRYTAQLLIGWTIVTLLAAPCILCCFLFLQALAQSPNPNWKNSTKVSRLAPIHNPSVPPRFAVKICRSFSQKFSTHISHYFVMCVSFSSSNMGYRLDYWLKQMGLCELPLKKKRTQLCLTNPKIAKLELTAWEINLTS